MERAQSQASCKEFPSCACSCLKPAQLLHAGLLFIHEQRGGEKGGPPDLPAPTGGLSPALQPGPALGRRHEAITPRSKAPQGHLQGPTLTLRQWVGATNSSGIQPHGTEREQWRREHVESLVREGRQRRLYCRQATAFPSKGMGTANASRNLGF